MRSHNMQVHSKRLPCFGSVHLSACRLDLGRSSQTTCLPQIQCLRSDCTTYVYTQKHNRFTSALICPIISNTALYHLYDPIKLLNPPTTSIAMAADPTRATLVRNPEYERNGLKSYVRALQKYGITPTVDGPYCLASKPESDVQGVFTDHGSKIITQEYQLVKRDAETARAGTVPVCLVL